MIYVCYYNQTSGPFVAPQLVVCLGQDKNFLALLNLSGVADRPSNKVM